MPPAPPVPPKVPEPPVDPSVVQLGQLMAVLGQDPKYRGQVLGLIREAAPNMPIPELDVARATEAKVETELKPLRDENKSLTDRLGRLEQSMAQRNWQEENGVDDEEFAAVTTFAKEKKIGDPNAALDYWRKADVGRPRGTAPSSALLNDESRKELYKNPKQWYEKEAHKILSESRRRRAG